MAVDVGQQAPGFTLLNGAGDAVSLSDFCGKNVIVAFFPAVFSGVCDNEMCTFRDSLSELNNADAEVIGISVDPRWAIGEFVSKYELTFPVLSDYSRQAIRDYDVVMENFAGMAGYDAAVRSVFVIGKDGTVRWNWVAEAPPVEPPYDEVKSQVAALG